jgi:hypothetical protein
MENWNSLLNFVKTRLQKIEKGRGGDNHGVLSNTQTQGDVTNGKR